MGDWKVTLAVVAVLALGAGCEAKMAPLDLSSAGLDATVSAPEGAKVEKGRFSGVTITHGDAYQLDIRAKAVDLAKTKADCAGAQHKNCEVITDQQDVLITKWVQFGKDVHRLHANVQAGGASYSCESDSKSGVAVKKGDAERMLETCKSIAPKK